MTNYNPALDRAIARILVEHGVAIAHRALSTASTCAVHGDSPERLRALQRHLTGPESIVAGLAADLRERFPNQREFPLWSPPANGFPDAA